MVITWRIRELAEARGSNISKLSFDTRITYSSVLDYWHNRVKRVDLEIMARFCVALECQPGDLFRVDESPTRATIDTERSGLAARVHARPDLIPA